MENKTIKSDNLPIEQFHQLLKQLLEEGYGEINYRIVVKDHHIEYYSLAKTNNFRIKSGII
jgi:hypothetical protein